MTAGISGFGDGTAGLDVMEAAPRYNAAIEADIVRAIGAPATTPAVLDVGSGDGEFARRLRARGYNVSCVEPSAAHARSLAADGFDVVADLSEIPVGAGFDAAIMINVLEHIEHDIDILRAICDRLRPGGRVFVWVPAFEVLYSDHDHLLGHYRRYRRQGLERAVSLAGFHVETTAYRDSLGWVAALGWRLRPMRGDAMVSKDAVAVYDRWLYPVSAVLDRAVGAAFGKNAICTGTKP